MSYEWCRTWSDDTRYTGKSMTVVRAPNFWRFPCFHSLHIRSSALGHTLYIINLSRLGPGARLIAHDTFEGLQDGSW